MMHNLGSTMIGAILIGMGMSLISIGPSFFLLIETTLKKGYRKAIFTELGIIISDIIIILLCFLGANFIPQINEIILNFIGSMFLLLYGLFKVIRTIREEKKHKTEQPEIIDRKRYTDYLLKGFIFNTMNPALILYWLGVVTASIQQFSNMTSKWILGGVYNLCIIAGFLTLDLAKIFFAGRLKTITTPKILYILDICINIMFIIAGIYIFVTKVSPYL